MQKFKNVYNAGRGQVGQNLAFAYVGHTVSLVAI